MTNDPQTLPDAGPQNRRPIRSLQNVVSNWGSYIFAILVGLFLSPFVVHHLGDTAYGVWTLMLSLVGYLGLLDFGVRGSVTRFVARFHARGEHESASRVASTALAIFAAAGVLAIVASITLAAFGLRYFHIPPEYHRAARIVLLLAGTSVAITLLGGVYGGILVGLHRFDLTNLVEIISSGVRALATVIALWRGKGIVTLALLQASFTLGNVIVRMWLSRRGYPELRIQWRYVDRANLRLIYSFSLYSFLLHVFGAIILYTDAIVIGLFLPISLVTFFSIGGNLFTYARGLLSGITQTITPLASKLEAEERHEDLRRTTLNMSGYATALMLPVHVTFLLRGGSVIGLWMGPEYASLSGQVLAVLAIAGIFSSAPAIGWATMFGISKHRAMVPVYLLEAFLNLSLSIWLVREFGIVGVAWGTTVPNLLVCLLFWPWYLQRALSIPRRQYVEHAWLRPLVAILPFALCTYAMEHWWPAHRLIWMFAQIGLALPVAAVPIWFLCIPMEERRNKMEQVREALRFARKRLQLGSRL